MPAPTRRVPRRIPLSPEMYDWLRDAGEKPAEAAPMSDRTIEELWRDNRERIVRDHIAEHPGTRPSFWWQFEAPRWRDDGYKGWYFHGTLPEPRKRVGGSGVPRHTVSAYKPEFEGGLTYHVRVDPDDLPTFESEATYLKRHGLLLTGELKRIAPEYFEPEALHRSWWTTEDQ